MQKKVLMGIDGGGTYTRVAVTDYKGNLLAHVKSKGGAYLRRDSRAKENVSRAIKSALDEAECSLAEVGALGIGVSGYDSEEDLSWVSELTNIDGLDCPKVHVNDAVIAHVGAFLGQKGIIAISGTGAIIYGKTELERHIRNYDFNHRTKTGAQHITYNFVHRVLAGDVSETDNDIVDTLLRYFDVKDITELAWMGASGFEAGYLKRSELFGDFAKYITDAAVNGSDLAKSICEQAAFEIATGIKIVAACFESDNINVALIGSVANSGYIRECIEKYLVEAKNKSFILNNSVLPAEFGAIVMAMQRTDIELNENIISNLKKSAFDMSCSK